MYEEIPKCSNKHVWGINPIVDCAEFTAGTHILTLQDISSGTKSKPLLCIARLLQQMGSGAMYKTLPPETSIGTGTLATEAFCEKRRAFGEILGHWRVDHSSTSVCQILSPLIPCLFCPRPYMSKVASVYVRRPIGDQAVYQEVQIVLLTSSWLSHPPLGCSIHSTSMTVLALLG